MQIVESSEQSMPVLEDDLMKDLSDSLILGGADYLYFRTSDNSDQNRTNRNLFYELMSLKGNRIKIISSTPHYDGGDFGAQTVIFNMDSEKDNPQLDKDDPSDAMQTSSDSDNSGHRGFLTSFKNKLVNIGSGSNDYKLMAKVWNCYKS